MVRNVAPHRRLDTLCCTSQLACVARTLVAILLGAFALLEAQTWLGLPLPSTPGGRTRVCAPAGQRSYCTPGSAPPPCSFEAASDHFACHGAYPRAGGFANGSAAWAPDPAVAAACGPSWARAAADPFGCLVPRGEAARYILLLGDSNGKRYTAALAKALTGGGANCSTLKRETAPNGSYFGLPRTVGGHVDCGSCSSFLARCESPKTGAAVELEYLRMEVSGTQR